MYQHVLAFLQHLSIYFNKQYCVFQLAGGPDTHTKVTAAKATGFLKFLLSKSGCYFLHFLLDVLNILTRVSKVFQKMDGTVGDVLFEIEEAKEQLKKLKER